MNILLMQVTLGDITILCLLKTTMLALFRTKDRYLLSNCLAILSNIAPYVANINSYTSERLVTIIEKLGQRILETEKKYVNLMNSQRFDDANNGDSGPTTSSVESPLNPPQSYLDVMQNMQDAMCVIMTLVCRSIRFS
jgi:hypothetical protein